MRAFIEGDFAGLAARPSGCATPTASGRACVVGQTWSTFADPEAEPDGIDFEGLNAIALFRQPLVRWTKPLGERVRPGRRHREPGARHHERQGREPGSRTSSCARAGGHPRAGARGRSAS